MSFVHSWLGLAFGAAFTALMAMAAGYDVRFRRIPNVLVVTTFALGAACTVLTLGIRALGVRFLGGAATGLAIWLPFWAVGVMGAGDVKIFGAASAWLGPIAALGAAVWAALAGGVLGLAWLVVTRRHPNAATPDGTPPRARISVPYGLAMAVGLTLALWAPALVHSQRVVP